MKYDIAIKKLRESMLLSQDEFAKMIGVSVVTVNRWENGKFEPTIKIKRKLMSLFKDNNIVDDLKSEGSK